MWEAEEVEKGIDWAPAFYLPATHDHWKGESPDEKGLGRDFWATDGELLIHFSCVLIAKLHGCEIRD